MLDQFRLKPSRIFALLLSSLHLLAACSVWLLKLAFWARLSLSLLIFASLFYHMFHYVFLRANSSWHSFTLSQNHIQIDMRNGEVLDGEIMPSTVVTAGCVVLRVTLGRRVESQVIFRDSMTAEGFRELRVRLRFA